VEPGKGAFDDPAVAAQPRSVLGLAASDDRLHAQLPDEPAVLVVVVAAVSDQLVQLLPHASLLPGAQPAPRRHPAAEAELLRQVLPADPCVQHEQDPCSTRRSSNGLRPG
jgi:hypothetical protein